MRRRAPKPICGLYAVIVGGELKVGQSKDIRKRVVTLLRESNQRSAEIVGIQLCDPRLLRVWESMTLQALRKHHIRGERHNLCAESLEIVKNDGFVAPDDPVITRGPDVRMPWMRGPHRTCHLMVHVSPSEKATIRGAADEKGLTMSDYIRQTALGGVQ